MPPLNLVGDFGGGAMFLAMGMCAAFFEAERSGKGQVIDCAMTDGSASLMTFFLILWRRAYISCNARAICLMAAHIITIFTRRRMENSFLSALLSPSFMRS